MPPVRAPLLRVMLSTRLAENNAAPSSSDLQWQPVIGIVAGFRKSPPYGRHQS